MEDGEYEVAAPTAIEVTAETYNATDLAGNDGRLFTMKDLTYVDGKITDVTAHTNINFEATKKDGTKVPVTFRANYHLGKTAMTELKEVVDGLSAGAKVDLTGVINWFKTPQLAPQFLAGKTPAQNITVHTQPNPTALTINGPKEVKATETITLTASTEPAGSSPAVTWKSSDDTIATIDENGVVTGVKEGKVTITATSKAVETLTATYEVTVTKAPVLNGPTPAEEFVVGGYYKIGVFQGNLKKDLFLTGEMVGNFGATTENYADAATFLVGGTKDAYTLKTGDKYLGMTQSEKDGKTYINVAYLAEEFTWKYNAEHNTFAQTMGGEEYYLGTYKSFDTFSASKLSYAATSFVSHLYEYAVSPEEAETVAEGDFYFGIYHAGLKNYYYLTGEMDGYYFATTTDVRLAKKVTVAKSGDGYTLKINGKYMNIVASGKFVNVVFQDEPAVWAYNAETKTFTVDIDGVARFLGTSASKTYETLSACKITDLEGSFAGTLYNDVVLPNPIGLVVSGDTEVIAGFKTNLDVTVYPKTADKAVTWASSDETIATVDANGTVTGVKEGKVTITATSTINTAVKATYEFTVTKAPEGMTTATFDCTTIPEGVEKGNPVGTLNLDSNVTFTGATGTSGTDFRWWTDGIRSYAGNTGAFSVAEGKTILKITIAANANVVGSIENATYDFDEATKVVTITPTDGSLPINMEMAKGTIFTITVVYANK